MIKRNQLEYIARQWISLWCSPTDWALFDQIHADHFEDCSSAGRPSTKEGFAAGLREMLRAFPDLTTTVEDMIVDVEGGRVSVRWKAQGTNRRSFLGHGPTNKIAFITGIEIIEIAESKIVKRWGEWDISSHFNDQRSVSRQLLIHALLF
ncbi:ester cyclase [Sphingobacterium haloxyli]|uniref:Ester cyclase n=1 Tax=Sphingobacterium haloxyli TaxID=2100533 RepID=A0A2S9IYL9_9SPHI|nr:ester cyclase [Sphingobacterium haloxyli]PRD45580.1 hypothetical protein C5745_17885 [Sphingobacterium haloxyli]